jgi:hypothetical protein
MKKITSLVIAVVAMVGLSLAWSALQVNVTMPSARAQAVNTPVALVDRSSVVSQLPSVLDQVEKPGQPQSEAPVAEQPVQKETDPERVRQKAETLRRAGVHFPVVNGGIGANQVVSSQAGETCATMLLNSKMDVVELGGGQGSIDFWSIVSQTVYYDSRAGYYNSPSYSLAMMDEQNGSDTALISPTLDYDAFGQGFMAPTQLTAITVTYSRLYSNTDSYDNVYANLWILNSQGNLGDTDYWWPVSETPSSWSNRYMAFTDPAELAFISGKPWALVFEMYSDRTPPAEIVWLDDAQVTLCYMGGAHKVYLPLVIKSPPSGPTCTPVEPDSVATRGTTAVGAICHGAFDTIDDKDYYSLVPNGVSNVKLWLRNIPANYGAAIFEDTAGYPLLCYISTPGSQDKSAECTLNLSRKYFVKVDRGSGGSGNYDMSVVAR